MDKPVMLDTGVVGMIAHPKANKSITDWLRALLDSGARVILPEIADYELRRELIRLGSQKSLSRLDKLREELEYAAITTEAMDLAASLWAESRNRGTQTCDPNALDGDAILAALARLAGARVATDNIGHLSQWVQADRWTDIDPTSDDGDSQ